ncbi:hypothetical protein EJF36_04155 [Bacillus sp. HMF5848]|uniref:tetratricopeptide repeat protein n=1 Tax=Bacillus sp. HMF5848 TaxID=2495421 RepID=UPI000F77471F|nr:tetratricopeptide repeat protein [Bacillus sp. HMF5848]RSK26133.1 hypothetical protein EJF36_04155 [Bacillus sp. HMF5848]
MSTNTYITIQSHKKTKQLDVKSLAMFHRIKVIKAIDDNKQVHYCVCYKQEFIAVVCEEKHVFPYLERLFSEGIVFENPHPLIHASLPNHPLHLTKSEQHLQHQLQKRYSPRELLILYPLFNSFIPTAETNKLFETTYYEYRRNGQLRNAFHVLMLISQVLPNHEWAQDMAANIEFLKYKSSYETENVLQIKDTLFLELHVFQNRTLLFPQLLNLLLQQDRWLDATAVLIEHLQQDNSYYPDFLHLLSKHFSKTQQAILLYDACKQTPPTDTMGYQLFQALVTLERYEEAINITSKYHLTTVPIEELSTIIRNDNLKIEKLNLENLQKYLIEQTEHIDIFVTALLEQLLKVRDIDWIVKWIQPLKSNKGTATIVKMLEDITRLQDEPDEQLQLGKLYYKLHQFEKALDCFSWEMELDPENYAAVQWVTKTYRELGMNDEYKNYMYFLTHMKNNQAQ